MSKRGELLKTLLVREISFPTLQRASEKLRGMTDKQKEEKAGQILTMLNNSKDEEAFISELKKLESMENM